MSKEPICLGKPANTSFVVPGTCYVAEGSAPRQDDTLTSRQIARDWRLRECYLRRALAEMPRLLGAIDRNPYRPTFGCLDRQYWHYRTSDFPSEMYQEGALPLALVYTMELPGNRWFGKGRVKELAVAAIRFAARSSHKDGSCDDYYPFERALGAAVFALAATSYAYQLLGLHDPEVLRWFDRRAQWLVRHDESGHLANHQALAALGLLRVSQITGDRRYREAAEARIDRLLSWQSDEGWFEEYGGADPGYQTVTIECLAQYRRLTGDKRLDQPLRRAVGFARLFLHPDASYAGEYGSRGTYHFYPHGMEILLADHPAAATEAGELADGFLQSLLSGTDARFGDDRMFAHQLASLLEAYRDWSPTRPTPEVTEHEEMRYLPQAQLLVRRVGQIHTVISAARGGVFKHFGGAGTPVGDAGLILETTDGRVAVSQRHDLARGVQFAEKSAGARLSVTGPLDWSRFETVTPPKQAILHMGMWTVGRWLRTPVRRLLQGRLITGRRPCPIILTRVFDLLSGSHSGSLPSLRVTDTIQLTQPEIRVRRMALGTDHQAAYVAASGVYQESVLGPWIDLAVHVDQLNAHRQLTVVREF